MSLLLFLFACASAPDGDAPDSGTAEPPAPVEGRFVLLDPLRGGALTEVSLTTQAGDATDTADGAGALPILPGPFVVTAAAEDARDHHLVGVAGEADFELIAFMSNRTLDSQVLRMLRTAPDPDKAFLVVAVDHPDLSPAAGASVAVDGDYEVAFNLDGGRPQERTEITAGASFVTFANVAPGPVEVTVTPPEGESCGVFPALQGGPFTLDVEADTVAVVTFHCVE